MSYLQLVNELQLQAHQTVPQLCHTTVVLAHFLFHQLAVCHLAQLSKHLKQQCTLCQWHLKQQCTLCQWHLKQQCTLCQWHLKQQCTLCQWHLKQQCTLCQWYLKQQCTLCQWYLKQQCTLCQWDLLALCFSKMTLALWFCSFGWEYILSEVLCIHAFHCKYSKDPDIHVFDRWMPATKTHSACTIHEDLMWLPLCKQKNKQKDITEMSRRMLNSTYDQTVSKEDNEQTEDVMIKDCNKCSHNKCKRVKDRHRQTEQEREREKESVLTKHVACHCTVHIYKTTLHLPPV